MELELGTRQFSVVQKPREWHTSQNHAPLPSSSATILSRRRSAAVHVPSPGPPPTQPIPHLPSVQLSQPESFERQFNAASASFDPRPIHGVDTQAQSYVRPSASANLVAVAAFSQARVPDTPLSSVSSSSTDNLSDPPPPSMLRTGLKSPSQTRDIIPDRLLLPPTSSRPTTERRPSSRSALTRALELARQAVQLDSTNDDPYGAVAAYGKSVALLSEVMERVMRGEDSSEASGRRKNGRRRSVVAQEEEVRRLKAIHDTYADRMNILSLIYSIPLPEHHSPSPVYAPSSVSASTDSTRPSSPSSISPTSDAPGEPRSRTSSTSSRSSLNDLRTSSETERSPGDHPDGVLTIGSAMFSPDATMSPRTPVGPSLHPYAASSQSLTTPSTHAFVGANTTPPRPQIGRPRASSSLPPPAPPPTTMLPPAPETDPSNTPPDSSGSPSSRRLDVHTALRQRGQSISHKRASSNSKLTSLQEENDKPNENSSQTPGVVPATDVQEDVDSLGIRTAQRDKHDSLPLPPIPSPSSPPADSVVTPRKHDSGDFSATMPPNPSHVATARPRGDSTFSTRSEVQPPPTQQSLINPSTTMGTIFQRRKPSPSISTSVATSPTESISSGSVPPIAKMTASSLPSSTASSLGISGRSRASSQPGRRPAAPLNSTLSLPSSTPPPQPMTTRKVSVSSKLNPSTPHITINTALLSPTLASASTTTPLVPPPPIPHANIPAAPLSPLPPQAPPDPLLKPYHMMNLLRLTMSSKTGGYVTRRLHVPQEVWSQGGAKLPNIPEKIRVVEVLCSALEELQTWSVEYFGAGNVGSGMALGIGSIGKKEGEAWATKLEDFSGVCDSVVGNFGKKLGVGEGFVTKKTSGVTSWGGKLKGQLDKFTNPKNLDSPAIYVQGLSKLFMQAQILDEHTKAMLQQPAAPLYASFPGNLRAALELKLRRASEFFARVVLTFVIRDMALLLDKYVKKCEKWLAE